MQNVNSDDVLPEFKLPKDRYDRIYDKLLKLIPDLRELKICDSRTSKSGIGAMDLHLNVLDKEKDYMIISLDHTYRHPSGDTIPDPDMQIRVHLQENWNKAEALTYQDTYVSQEVYPEPGKVYPKLKTQLNSFLRQWLINLKNQGHDLSKENCPDAL